MYNSFKYILFKFYDTLDYDGDGEISRDELKQIDINVNSLICCQFLILLISYVSFFFQAIGTYGIHNRRVGSGNNSNSRNLHGKFTK